MCTTAIGATLLYPPVQQALGQYRQGQAAGDIADYQAGLYDRAARDAEQRGAVAADERRQQARREVGAARASAGARGVAVNTGSALDVQAGLAELGELDALTIENNASREAYGYRTQAVGARARGRYAETAGRNRAVGTLLTGGARLAGMGFGVPGLG